MRGTLLACLILVTSFISCAQDKVINDDNAEKRTVSNFHAIRVSGGIDLYIVQGNEEGLAVSASKDEYRDKIRTEVQDGILKIWYDNGGLNITWALHDRRLKAYVSIKTIDGIYASGGSDIYMTSGITAGKMSLQLNGGSDFKGKIIATDLDIEQHGGSDVSISGTTVNLKVKASGGSDFKGYGLVADYAMINANGGSDARLTVNKELSVEAHGGSDIDYKGKPVIKLSSKNGGSSITRRD